MTNTTDTKVHVRTGELASTAAVALRHLAEAGDLKVMTYWSKDEDGFAHRVPVKEVMWTAGRVPTIVFVLENGQEFEADVRPSSRALRHAANELEKATQRAEREQAGG